MPLFAGRLSKLSVARVFVSGVGWKVGNWSKIRAGRPRSILPFGFRGWQDFFGKKIRPAPAESHAHQLLDLVRGRAFQTLQRDALRLLQLDPRHRAPHA